MTVTPLTRVAIEQLVMGYERAVMGRSFQNEIDYIRRTLAFFSQQRLGPRNHRVETQASVIHGSPRIEYISQLTNQPVHVEFADLIFVFKHYFNQNLVEKRGLFVQCKYEPTGYTWHIDQEQFDFLSSYPQFRFWRPLRNNWYTINPVAISWAMYGFGAQIAPNTPIYQPVERIRQNAINIPRGRHNFPYNINPLGWDSNRSFLLRLMQGRLGENLLRNADMATLIHDLYIAVHLAPDPPSDMEFDKDIPTDAKSGIGLIEIRINEENNDFQVSA